MLAGSVDIGGRDLPTDRACILDKGHVRFIGSVEEFEANESLRQEYLSV